MRISSDFVCLLTEIYMLSLCLVLADDSCCSNFIIKVLGRFFIFHCPAQICDWKFITTEIKFHTVL